MGNAPLDSAAHVKPEHAASAARQWPSVKSRRCAPTVLAAQTPVRYLSVDTATRHPKATQGDTRRAEEETTRIAALTQLSGRFRRWWQVVDRTTEGVADGFTESRQHSLVVFSAIGSFYPSSADVAVFVVVADGLLVTVQDCWPRRPARRPPRHPGDPALILPSPTRRRAARLRGITLMSGALDPQNGGSGVIAAQNVFFV